MESGWIVSRRSRGRLLWSVGVLAVVAVPVVVAVLEAVREPSVPSVVLAAILVALGAASVVLAGESFGSGFVKLDAAGYRVPMGTPRAWSDVLAVGWAAVEGREVVAVAVHSPGETFPVVSDLFPGFDGPDAEALAHALRARAPEAAGDFSGVDLPSSWWAEVEAEASRVRAVVAETTGREPLSSERIVWGYPGLVSAVLLDYGVNDAGEGVQVLIRRSADLAVVREGVRYVRQVRKRTPDAATEVGLLFDDHTMDVMPATGHGFAQAVITLPGRRPLRFTAEEPDRYR